jgi:hypothetical protein
MVINLWYELSQDLLDNVGECPILTLPQYYELAILDVRGLVR